MFRRAFDISPREFSWLVSSYQLSAAISGFAAAFFLDRFGRKSALLILYMGFLLGTLGCALAPNFPFLIAARVIAGAFGGVLAGLVFSIVGDQIPESRRGEATGTVMAAFSVASVVGVPLGIIVAQFWEWHAPFFVIVGVGSLVWLAAASWLPTMRDHLSGQSVEFSMRTQVNEISYVLNSKNRWTAFGLIMSLMFGGFMLIPFIAIYMVQNVGILESQLPLIYLIGGLFTFFTSRWIGRLSDKYGKRKIFNVVALSSIAPILLLTHLPPLPLVWALSASTFFMILFSGRFVPAMSMVTSSVDPRHRGGFMSLNSCLQQASAGLGSLVAGYLVTQSISDPMSPLEGFGIAGWISVAFTLIAVLLVQHLRYGTQVAGATRVPSSTAADLPHAS